MLQPAVRWLRRRRVAVGAVAVIVVIGGVWGVRVAHVLASVDARADYWSVPRGEAGGLVYVALGDSAAQGVGASSAAAGYVSLIADRLREATGQPVQVINLSTSGARIADVVDHQLPQLAQLCADLITVGVGGNDIRDYDADRFARDVEALVNGLPAGTVIADVPYFMHGQWQEDADVGRDVVTTRAEAAALVVAPLQASMMDRGWRAMLTDYAADWFHPNDRGHRVWADAFWERIGPMASELRPSC